MALKMCVTTARMDSMRPEMMLWMPETSEEMELVMDAMFVVVTTIASFFLWRKGRKRVDGKTRVLFAANYANSQ